MERWAIFIDMEGFYILWEKEDQILRSLGELMRAIYRIGIYCYPAPPERLFAHQLGDGFLVASDFSEENLERPITIAVALMKHIAASGRFTKAAIAEGELSDIQGCYPKEVMDSIEDGHTVHLRTGLMTIFPVMGTALIRSFKTMEASPRGPLLTIEKTKSSRIPSSIPILPINETNLLSIDWVQMDTPLLRHVQGCSGLSSPNSVEIKMILSKYCEEHHLPEDWLTNTHEFLIKNKP